MNKRHYSAARLTALLCVLLPIAGRADDEANGGHKEKAQLTAAPLVPPPITRKSPAVVQAYLAAGYNTTELAPGFNYVFWTFNGTTPAPFIRARVGDTLEIMLSNNDNRGLPHNIDFHAVTGPGGGADVLNTTLGGLVEGSFKLLYPGLFIYHCAQIPMAEHIANGMYGLILVEPEAGLPKVDHEFYVLQSEFYTNPPVKGKTLEYSHEDGLKEQPRYVVFNGRVGSLTGENALQVKTGERVRIYFGNAGPNLDSSFHVVGAIFDKLYREGDLVDPPVRGVGVTLVPAAGTAVMEIAFEVPGEYTIMDHSIFRTEKGALGIINVTGQPRPDIYHAVQ